MKRQPIIKQTADGSYTLFDPVRGDTYHSMNGAVQESQHVFINAGLQQIKKTNIKIFEMGFGTGLNALLTWGEAHQKKLEIGYDAIEAFPVSSDVVHSLNYRKLDTGLPSISFLQLHLAEWDTMVELEHKVFSIRKIAADFSTYKFSKKYDLFYYDAFAPDMQAEMWEESLFKKIFSALNEGGIIVTYCAKGEVRRRLEHTGFIVERLAGPAGKREMLRARKKS